MEANGMSVRLIELLQRAVSRMRGGLNVVMVTSMVLFSGISGLQMADVAAVLSADPAARRSSAKSRQRGGAAGGVRRDAAETIPPCINLIILELPSPICRLAACSLPAYCPPALWRWR